MLAAIEVYNKPRFDYRDECFVILLVNAWELLLKALLSKSRHSIYYRKRRGEPYRTLSWQDAYSRIVFRKRWPAAGPPELAVRRNLELLTTYRDSAVHFYNEPRFGILIYSLAQTSVLNYRDVLHAGFKVDLSDELNWHLLPLGVRPPVDPIAYLAGRDRDARAGQAARDFASLLREYTAELEDKGIDTGRLLTVFDINLQSTKKIEQADLIAGIGTDQGEEPRIVSRPMDPNKTHPLLQKHALEKVGELHGTKFTSYSFQAVVHRYHLKEQPRMCWIDEETHWPRWSPEVVTFIRSLSAQDITDARRGYGEEQRRRRTRN
jgi:Domain of unknown function (DUF3644)